MKTRAIRVLIALYPRPWRERYGSELENLTLEVIRRGESARALVVLDLIRGAATERLRAHPAAASILAAAAAATTVMLVEPHQVGAGHSSIPQLESVRPASALARDGSVRWVPGAGSGTISVEPLRGMVVSVNGAPSITLHLKSRPALSATELSSVQSLMGFGAAGGETPN
jgi:hypothetical protein